MQKAAGLGYCACMSKRTQPDDTLGSVIKDLFGRDIFGGLFGKGPSSVVTATEARVDVAGAPRGRRPYKTTLDGESLVLDVDLPGIDPRDVTLHVTNTQVIVKGTTPGGHTGFTHRYTLSADYDLATASATMANGQLRVRVTRVAATAPRRVPIDHATC